MRRPSPLRIAARALPAVLAVLAATPGPRATAQGTAPCTVEASLDTSGLANRRRATAELAFTPDEPLATPLAVRFELRAGGATVLRRDHAPPVAVTEWPEGRATRYELPLVFAVPSAELRAADSVEVWVGLLDPATDRVVGLLGAPRDRDGMVRVGRFPFALGDAEVDRARVEAVVDEALDLADDDPAGAWDLLEATFRATPDYALKDELRKALEKVGRFAPPEPTFEERHIVRARIADERRRYLRQVSGRMFDQGQLHGALLLLDEIGGELKEQADRAVLGALSEAQRVGKRREDVVAAIFELSSEQKRRFAALREKHGDTLDLLEAGRDLEKAGDDDRPLAREIYRTLTFQALDDAVRARGEAEQARIEKAWLADVPADERAAADAARNHPAWARTATRVSHRFVFIGPQALVRGIPDDSALRFDLAYLYLTDLFGRVPNPGGDRVTVYFKELWPFGGGIGGGKIIDIGRADPDDPGRRVDDPLLFHELTHCVDDTAPIYPGFREGLADFGAAFLAHGLGDRGQARALFGRAQAAFEKDYLARDLEYWRIPNYAPSCGFLLHFVREYGRAEGGGYRWDLYREFFRRYRADRIQDARTPQIARAFAFHLSEVFGKKAFDDLIRFRWPLVPSDYEAIRREQATPRSDADPFDFEEFEGSPVPRDLRSRRLAERGGDLGLHCDVLGVIEDWWVIGPFKKPGTDADAFVFPPEYEIDLQARYRGVNNNPTWRRPNVVRQVRQLDTGWLQFDFPYMDDTAIYALTHVDVREGALPTDPDDPTGPNAWIHVRADDDLTVFVNDDLVGKYTFHGNGRTGPWRPGNRVLLADAIRFPIRLRTGRNKILVKVYNRVGGSGMVAAIGTRNGDAIPDWLSDAEPPARKSARPGMPEADRWKAEFEMRFTRRGAERRLDVAVGAFEVRSKALEGTSRDRGVAWRKYTVRPGFPKDSPSNLAWLPEKATEDLRPGGGLHLLLDLEPPPDGTAGDRLPKLCVIFQGDGGDDALSGWTLVLAPAGEGTVQARLERYDRLVYQSDLIPIAEALGDGRPVRQGPRDDSLRLTLQTWNRRLTVRLGAVTLFDEVPFRPIVDAEPDPVRIGFATWGPETRIRAVRLATPGRTRGR